MLDTNNSAHHALAQLDREFIEWRQHKKSSHDKIPLSLLQKANELTHHFDDLKIRNTLGITARQGNEGKRSVFDP